MANWIVRNGTPADASEIANLVNRAYRGQGDNGGMQGWTNESGLVEGPRTSAAEILQHMQEGTFFCARETADGPLRGSVWLAPREGEWYIGMFSVAPSLQNSGLGRFLMRHCETLARGAGIPRLTLTVLSPRAELQAWYERQGYVRTGEAFPFPHGGPHQLFVFRKTAI